MKYRETGVRKRGSFDTYGDTEEVGRSITAVSTEIEREDDRNSISVLINAISVRINMPRGTVKVLLKCFSALVIVAVLLAATLIHASSHTYYDTAEYQKGVTNVSEKLSNAAQDLGKDGISGEIIVPEREVAVSEHYSYIIPAGAVTETPIIFENWFMNAQAFSFYDGKGGWFIVTNYTMELNSSQDMEEAVRERLSYNIDMVPDSLSCVYEDYKGIRMLVSKYKSYDADEGIINVTEFSWMDGDTTVCSIAIWAWNDDGREAAEAVRNTIFLADNSELKAPESAGEDEAYSDGDNGDYPADYDPDDPVSTGEADPYAAMEEEMDEAMAQEAAEAWAEYNEPPENDISDRIIKP